MAVLASAGMMTVAQAAPAKAAGKPTVAEAERFVAESEAMLKKLDYIGARAAWVSQNFITDDTEIISAQSSEQRLEAGGAIAFKARRFNASSCRKQPHAS